MWSVLFELFFKYDLTFSKIFFLASVFFPLLSFFTLTISNTVSFKIHRYVSLFYLWSSFEISFVLLDFFFKTGQHGWLIQGPIWFTIPSINYIIRWNFIVDSITLLMFCVVLLVSFLVHFYSLGYMSHDPNKKRFMSYLSLFTFFMLFLVCSGNLIQFFIGWEGVGLCSFLLIGFWTTRIAANKAALKAMVVNKFGDYFLLYGMALLVFYFNTLELGNFCLFFNMLFSTQTLYLSFFGYSFSIVSFIAFFLFLGIMAKSAQFGFHTWLPDAMEGPTPVSALIHAATMVTAGVFLFIRFNFFFLFAFEIKPFIIFIGTLTTFFAATVALIQYDIKKIIAYSTCSQLGYMVTACGFDLYGFAFFHLAMHAFFKALLFLGAGSVIHALSDEQDIRKMGGLAFKLPFTCLVMVIASLSLAGFPFWSGFYSKEGILEAIFSIGKGFSLFAYFFGVVSVFLTSFYSFRLIFLVFFGTFRGSLLNFRLMHKTSFYIILPLFILSFLSIFLGYSAFPYFMKLHLNFFYFGKLICPSLFFKVLPLFLVFFGIYLSYQFFVKFKILNFENFFCQNPKLFRIYREVLLFLNKKWYVDSFYNHVFSSFFYYFAWETNYIQIEKGWIEFFGPTGIYNSSFFLSQILNFFHSRSFKFYIFCNIIIIMVFCFFFIIF